MQTALFGQAPPAADRADHIGFPVGDVSQVILHRPGVFAFRAGDGPLPFCIVQAGNQRIQHLKLTYGAVNDFFTGVAHG